MSNDIFIVSSFKVPVLQNGILTAVQICSSALGYFGNGVSHDRSYPPQYEILSKIKMNVKKTGTVIKYNGQEQD